MCAPLVISTAQPWKKGLTQEVKPTHVPTAFTKLNNPVHPSFHPSFQGLSDKNLDFGCFYIWRQTSPSDLWLEMPHEQNRNWAYEMSNWWKFVFHQIRQTARHVDMYEMTCCQHECPVVTGSAEKPNNVRAGPAREVRGISQKYETWEHERGHETFGSCYTVFTRLNVSWATDMRPFWTSNQQHPSEIHFLHLKCKCKQKQMIKSITFQSRESTVWMKSSQILLHFTTKIGFKLYKLWFFFIIVNNLSNAFDYLIYS